MSKGIKRMLNIDKLEICYRVNKEIANTIEQSEYIQFNGFNLNKIIRNDIANYYSINIYDEKFENGQYQLGEFKIGNKFEKEKDEFRYCWILVNNECLYNNSAEIPYYNCLDGIEEEIGLHFNNLTNFDIAIDSNYNFYKKVWKEIRNKETINVILNKRYPNTKETLLGLTHEFSCNSERMYNGGIRIINKEKDMKLRIYDKTQEIIDSSNKLYIQNRFVSIKKVFRAEVRLKNKAIDDYCIKNNLTQFDIYAGISDDKLLFDIFCFFSDRLIHFIDSQRNKISILDL